MLTSWRSGRRCSTCALRRRLLVATTATFALLNLPVAVLNPSGWWWPYAFQSRRDPTWGTAWLYGFRALGLPIHGPAGAHLATVVSAAALLGGMAWLLAVTVHRRIDPFGAAAAAVAIFVLCNKVYSPTYDVWLVAFFVMLPLSRRLWVSFCAVDAAVFVTVYGYFAGIDSIGFVRTVLPLLVLVRTGGANVVRIVSMGGAAAEGNMTPAAEFNIWADPEAATTCFACWKARMPGTPRSRPMPLCLCPPIGVNALAAPVLICTVPVRMRAASCVARVRSFA